MYQMQFNSWTPRLIVACGLFCLAVIAGMIEVGLIPLFIPNHAVDAVTKTSTITTTGMYPYSQIASLTLSHSIV